nr:hypothetical protein Iba_chr14cCG9060 [Ipomoea batatas]
MTKSKQQASGEEACLEFGESTLKCGNGAVEREVEGEADAKFLLENIRPMSQHLDPSELVTWIWHMHAHDSVDEHSMHYRATALAVASQYQARAFSAQTSYLWVANIETA